MNYLKWGLSLIILIQIAACKKETKLPEAPELPVIRFSANENEYKTKAGKPITLQAIVENAEHPVYSWKLDGKIVSTGLTYAFETAKTGDYFFTFRVDAKNGSREEQVKVSVLHKLPPTINMNNSLIVWAGKETELKAIVENADTPTYTWRLDGIIVSTDSIYSFTQNDIGQKLLSLKVSTPDGEDLTNIKLTVLPAPTPGLYFDNGHYRVAGNINEQRRMSVSLGRTLVVAPVIENIDNPLFEWSVAGVKQSETGEYFHFSPTAKGEYLIEVKDKTTDATATVLVTCTDPEGTFFRPQTSDHKDYASLGFDFVPAPGQFINYGIGTTRESVLNSFKTTVSNGGMPYIGAYGGYYIVGFDHSVEDKANIADLRIDGNAFAGWSEPGIVWVMQDENGNGLPDDTWYELKGSEAGKPETKFRYAITYYKPSEPKMNVLWSDNMGQTGSVDYNSYHSQPYYFPMFITEEYYQLTGTRLASTMEIGAIETSAGFPWGYVDNFGDGSKINFWIEDAIKADGTAANLKYIDFVKVHTAMLGKGAAVGEISTEAGIPYNLNFKQ